MTTLEQYVDLVFDWDGATYKSIAHRVSAAHLKQGPTSTVFAQAACVQRDDFLKLIRSRVRMQTDVYVALGSQVAASDQKTKDGYVKPYRRQPNIATLKCLWTDVDVGKPGAYLTCRKQARRSSPCATPQDSGVRPCLFSRAAGCTCTGA